MSDSTEMCGLLSQILHYQPGARFIRVASATLVSQNHSRITNLVYLTCKCFRMPFDSSNPIGFLIATIFTYILGRFVLTFLAHIASIGIGSHLYLISFTKDFKGILNRINESGKNSSSQRSQTIKYIIEYVQLQTIVKQLSQCDNFTKRFLR